MKTNRFQNLLIGLSMLIAAGLAIAMAPSAPSATGSDITLEKMVPATFEEWRIDSTIVAAVVSPDVQAEVNKIYNQTLNRIYVNTQGERIMLSIAYGGNQSDALQAHLPEGCYRGQGFDIKWSRTAALQLQDAKIPVVNMLAEKGARIEPITYWLLIGNDYASNRTERKLAQLRYALTRQLPEGMLVRVSSLGTEPEQHYRLHERFVRVMLGAMSPQDRKRLSGTL